MCMTLECAFVTCACLPLLVPNCWVELLYVLLHSRSPLGLRPSLGQRIIIIIIIPWRSPELVLGFPTPRPTDSLIDIRYDGRETRNSYGDASGFTFFSTVSVATPLRIDALA